MKIKPIQWKNNKVYVLDQTQLPLKTKTIECSSYKHVAQAIRKMNLRGAPLIGVAAAMGIALGALELKHRFKSDKDKFLRKLKSVMDVFSGTRPTAVNLFWAISRMEACVQKHNIRTPSKIAEYLVEEALSIYTEDIRTNQLIGLNGARLIKEGDVILTHCNAGILATAGYGTALSVISTAHNQGKKIKVYVDETRPFLQGARLTAWELHQQRIPFVLICDNMAGYFMQKGAISAIIIGADRITSNGDVANKIGSYTLSVLAKEHKIPFYVAAPVSTIDMGKSSGKDVIIEQRNSREVTHISNKRITMHDIKVANPAFDITPYRHVTAIITEKGVVLPPYKRNLMKLFI